MLTPLEILAVAVLVVVLLVLSVLDFALAGVNKIALRRITETAPRSHNSLKNALVESREEVLMAIHISIQTMLIAIAVLLTYYSIEYTVDYRVSLPSALGATVALVLVFRQLLPRAIALRDPEAVLSRLVSVLGVPYFLLRPLVGGILAILRRFENWEAEESEDEDEASEEEIQAFIDAGQEEGILEQDEGVMIQSIVQFGDKLALGVMTPRPKVVAADISWGLDRVIDLAVSSRHSRIPVYRGELDNIEGVLHVRDLLRFRNGQQQPDTLHTLLHPAHFVPETKPVDDLLEEMKAHGHRLTLVVDEYGGVSGLITIEDLVEEIVGEIHDDPEAMRSDIVEEGAAVWLMPANTELDGLVGRLGRPVFPETEATTVGGAVLELFGHLPAAGETIRHGDLLVEVVAADRRRVKSVRIRVAVPQTDS
jgi:CBS domain containing-hemolysin-like protein